MSQFPDYQLAHMRGQVEQFLKDTCIIRRPTAGFDTYGHSLDSETVIATDVPCRLLPIRERDTEQMAGEAEAGRVYYRVILPYDTAVQDNDVLVIDAVRYEGLQVEKSHTDRVDIRVRVSKVGA